MANVIVVLSETVSRLEAQFRLLFLQANVRQCFKWEITDCIKANLGLCLVSSMIILLQLTYVYLLCHQYEPGRHLRITFFGLMPCQQYFRCKNVTYHGIVLPM